MFNTDKPINNISSDLLNRASFQSNSQKQYYHTQIQIILQLVYAANGDLERLLFLIW